MKFLIIIPVHNEANILEYGMASLAAQTHRDFTVLWVNDGSSDASGEIIEAFISRQRDSVQYQCIHLPKSPHQPGAKVVTAFYEGLKAAKTIDYDVVCKWDADIIFPSDYLEKIAEVYQRNPKAGMVSGIVFVEQQAFIPSEAQNFNQEEQNRWKFESISSRNHVRGPVKSYRKECFQDMGGLKPMLGWDNADVLLAKAKGWEVITLPNVWVKHLRPTADKYAQSRYKKMGTYFYNLGLDVPLTFFAALKYAVSQKKSAAFWQIMLFYFRQNHPRVLSEFEIKSIKKIRYQDLYNKLFGTKK